MKLQTQVPLSKVEHPIDYNSQMLLLGSCFVENIGKKFSYYKFQTVQNPFGILFHPLAIEKLISRAIGQNEYTEKDVFYLNERWQCYDAHSDLSSVSRDQLVQNLNNGLSVTLHQIKKASHVIITLGTVWVYALKETAQEVANCHKVPQREFDKKILSVSEIVASLQNTIAQIKSVNAEVKIIFTVSPVRHLKDGFVENQLSKAHLLTAIHEVLKDGNAVYFPSYEIMMDELRDYRFYADDMIHPNTMAVNYIWEQFKSVWVSDSIEPIMNDVDSIQKGLRHRPFNQESEQHQKFTVNLERKIAYLQEEYSFMNFKK